MTASFRLTLREDLSATFDKLTRKLNIFRDLADKLGGRNVFGGMNDNINTADTGLGRLNERLNGTTSSAGRAGARLRGLGADARAGAAEGVAALDSLQRKLQAISATDIARAVRNATAPSSLIKDRPEDPPGYVAGVRDSFGHFHEASERAAGSAMGAAATGFGLVEPVEHFREMDKEVRQTGVDLHLDAGQMDAFTSAQLTRDYALAQATNQSSRSIAASAHYLALSHLDTKTIDALQPTIAQTATAFGVKADEVTPTAFHLNESLNIAPEDMKLALARTARAATMSHLNFRDLSAELPALLVQGSATGLKGQSGYDRLLSYLVVSKNNAATVGEAATNLAQSMAHVREPTTAKAFRQLGVDLPKALRAADAKGVDPLRATIDLVRYMTRGKNDLDRGQILGHLFRNTQEAQFFNAATSDKGYAEIDKGTKEIRSVGADEIDRDFKANLTGVDALLNKLKDDTDQLSDRFGRGFVPVLRLTDTTLTHLLAVLNWLDRTLGEGVGNAVIGTMGSLLAFATVIGVLGAASTFLRAGFGLLGTVLGPVARGLLLVSRAAMLLVAPIGLVGAAILALVAIAVVAAIAIYRHWDRFRSFFAEIAHGAMEVMRGWGNFLVGVFTGNFVRAAAGLRQAFGGIGDYFKGVLGVVRGLMTLFIGWLDSWTGGLGSRILGGIKAGWGALTAGFRDLVGELEKMWTEFAERLSHNWVAEHLGLGGGVPGGAAATAAATPAKVEVSGGVHVSTSGGAAVTKVTTGRSSAVPLMPARARGPMTARP